MNIWKLIEKKLDPVGEENLQKVENDIKNGKYSALRSINDNEDKKS